LEGHAAGPGTEAIVNRVQEIAAKKGISMAQVALAWSMARTTAPIVGTTSLKNLEDSISQFFFAIRSVFIADERAVRRGQCLA
jgi:aryl-alcohol dehydrogenase-like predicted oxidoreductase